MSTGDVMPQPGLPGLDEPVVPTHRLFFALVPDDDMLEAVAGVAAGLRQRHALQARWVDPSRYHVTLAFLGDHVSLRPAMIEAAGRAAARVRVAPFDWQVDQVSSFKGRRPPCVLGSAQTSQPLHTLWEQLRRELGMERLARQIERNFHPHVTLAYSQHALLAAEPVGPLSWPVRRIVLLHSEIGRGSYQELGAWMLPG